MNMLQKRAYVSLGLLVFGIFHSVYGDFRGWDFGDDFEKITRGETAEYVQTTATNVVFSDSIFGFETKVIFHFSPETEGLSAGVYEINCTGFDVEEVLDHYMKVKHVMDTRYTESMKSGIIWWEEGSQYKNDLVNAFRFADVSFRNEWYGPGVIVTISLSNQLNTQGKVIYRIDYQKGRQYDAKIDSAKL